MKRSLLDINVLIALMDSNHVLHSSAIRWISQHGKNGWASCPITQNGCLRIMAQPNYPNPRPIQAIRERLSQACAGQFHEFWPDDISLLEDSRFDSEKLHGPKQLTDIYLLALAVRHGGRFVTFDGAMTKEAVNGIDQASLVIL